MLFKSAVAGMAQTEVAKVQECMKAAVLLSQKEEAAKAERRRREEEARQRKGRGRRAKPKIVLTGFGKA